MVAATPALEEEEVALLTHVQAVITQVVERVDNPNTRLLHTLATICEAHEARLVQPMIEDAKKAIDVNNSSPGLEPFSAISKEEYEDRFIVVRAAEAEARSANAPNEAVKAAGDAAAELVKSAAFEVWKSENNGDVVVLATEKAAATVKAPTSKTASRLSSPSFLRSGDLCNMVASFPILVPLSSTSSVLWSATERTGGVAAGGWRARRRGGAVPSTELGVSGCKEEAKAPCLEMDMVWRGRVNNEAKSEIFGASATRAMAEPTKGRTEIEVGEDGVAIITICIPPVISLSIYGTAAAVTASALCFGLGCWPGSSSACPDRCPVDLGSDPGVAPRFFCQIRQDAWIKKR
ncbi:hypothetical protein E2562_018051 [Oryza meyeriana var. granulata]|uniref:Uncharacterized protein n=1 Tax=Oryza meyeriana var. granulata TaxID=110450 RepID=A0A6G1CPM5_9ORYZ|nr:hypothetical protein E2562_018051 [Oryza meyeriana var. granulata]